MFYRIECRALPAFSVYFFANPIGLAQSQPTRVKRINDPISEKDLATLVDPIFVGQMEKLHIPGAVISVVKDGRMISFNGGKWK